MINYQQDTTAKGFYSYHIYRNPLLISILGKHLQCKTLLIVKLEKNIKVTRNLNRLY